MSPKESQDLYSIIEVLDDANGWLEKFSESEFPRHLEFAEDSIELARKLIFKMMQDE